MSTIEYLWEEIEKLSLEEKAVLYRRMEEEQQNKIIDFHCVRVNKHKANYIKY
jgi:hypothetical protein